MSERPRILIVDDDQPILLLMRNLLSEFGFEPVEAGTGPDALASARERIPDLVLLDRNMPGMSGDEVLDELREIPAMSQVPIIIISGEPIPPAEVSRLGLAAAILKPFDVIALIEMIRSSIAAKRSLKSN
ncbi:MAG TPA: response regulator [Thermoanaerobaculia bacterium]